MGSRLGSVITLAMALETLGSDYRFRTELGLGAPYNLGKSNYFGNLILHSVGDPSLAPYPR